jgi:photosystem II stability/assembly factor-like uncharacterized protein
MKLPTKKARKGSARERASKVARARYPWGKALARIRYFEAQRGLPETEVKDGCVRSAAATAATIARRPSARKKTPAIKRPYVKAHRVKAALAPSFAAATQLPVWRALGPSSIPKGQTYGTGGNNKPPVSGRCSGIVISPTNPSHLVLCSGGGGLWRTLDQGATWHPLTDDQPVLSMGAIAAAPSAPNTVYAGTGEGDNESQLGVGLLRSSDGGQTWTLVPAADLSGTGIFDIAVDPGDPLHVWVGTLEKLLESKNGGSTWRVVQSVTTWDISINPTNPQEILAATTAGLIRSTNGGTTWTRVALPGSDASSRFTRLEVCHAPSSPAIVYVAGVLDGQGRLWRRATAGGAFSSQTIPPLKADSDINQSWYDWCLAVSPANPNLLFWGAVHLYRGRRSSSGWQWQNVSSRASGDSIHPDQHHIAFDPSNPAVVYVCNDGGLFRSPNEGTNWTSLNKGLDITEFEFLIHLEGDDNWIIGGTQDNGTLANATARTWNQIALGDGGDCGADEAQNLCYHSYYGMWIERAPATGPGAFRWTDVSPPVDDNYRSLFYPPMDVVGSLLARAGVTLFVSEDSGQSWIEIDFGMPGRASALTIHDKTTIFLGTERGGLARIKRGSTGWGSATVTSLTSPRNAFISDIVVPGAPDDVIWASSSAFGGGHVFRSADGGGTWADRSGNLPDIPVNAIVVDPQALQRVFAATDHGVYQTANAGTKWTDYSNGLPNVVVGDLILHERLRRLRAGTRNRGAWEIEI